MNQKQVNESTFEWPEDNDILIIQKYVYGNRHNCFYSAINGEMYQYFELKTLRTDKIDFTGYEVEACSLQPTPQLKKYTRDIVEKLNYTGIGCVQFLMESETKEINFLELNPRLDASCAIPYQLGFDFPKTALDIMRGKTVLKEPDREYPNKKRGHWWLGDVQGLFRSIQNRTISIQQALEWFRQLIRTTFTAPLHLTWSWKDPLPSIFLFSKLTYSILKWTLRKLKLS